MHLTSLLLLVHAVVGAHAKVKVFILSGQSNMVGMGDVGHLKLLINSTNSKDNEYRNELWNGTGFRYRNDAFIKNGDCQGNLTVGYGNPGDDKASDGAVGTRFGPELGFGWYLADEIDQDIVLIKAAWGGRDLGVDFRPPLSGEADYYVDERLRTTDEKVKPSHYGWEYRQLIEDVTKGLEAIPEFYPRFNESESYELSGFVWFQGYNDVIAQRKVDEYSYNLANFIRDVRKDIGAPNLPFVIGELGMHGNLSRWDEKEDLWLPRVRKFRESQKNVTLMAEFRDNTLFVPTSPYIVFNSTEYNGQYHYYGRADTFYHIGKAFGRGMVEFLGFEAEERIEKVGPKKNGNNRRRRS